MKRLLASVSLLLCLLYARAPAYPEPATAPDSSTMSRNYDLLQILYPGILQDVPLMFRFIRHELPSLLRLDSSLANADSITHDLRAVDFIYLKALQISHRDIARALLLSSLASLTHRSIPLAIGLPLPLTLESDEAHRLRSANLPRVLFNDSDTKGDADKLQHFFGSAYLSLRSDAPLLSDLFGLLLEHGEEQLIADDENDARDIRANRLGQAFALALEQQVTTLPSALFRYWNTTGSIPFGDDANVE